VLVYVVVPATTYSSSTAAKVWRMREAPSLAPRTGARTGPGESAQRAPGETLTGHRHPLAVHRTHWRCTAIPWRSTATCWEDDVVAQHEGTLDDVLELAHGGEATA